MTSEGFWEMFEGDSADMGAGKFLLTLMGGLSGGSRGHRPGSKDPISMSRNFGYIFFNKCLCNLSLFIK